MNTGRKVIGNMSSNQKLAVITSLGFGYLTLPFLFAWYMYYLLSIGTFPPESDSISIPIAGFTFIWLVFGITIFLLIIAIKVLRNLSRLK
jgi:hypothetical protein